MPFRIGIFCFCPKTTYYGKDYISVVAHCCQLCFCLESTTNIIYICLFFMKLKGSMPFRIGVYYFCHQTTYYENSNVFLVIFLRRWRIQFFNTTKPLEFSKTKNLRIGGKKRMLQGHLIVCYRISIFISTSGVSVTTQY